MNLLLTHLQAEICADTDAIRLMPVEIQPLVLLLNVKISKINLQTEPPQIFIAAVLQLMPDIKSRLQNLGLFKS
jgi:hypothetical protein